jgi:hypothetical protein
MRVTFLERALKPAKKKSSVDVLNTRRSSAEEDAVREAVLEFYKQQEIEYYLRNPNVVELALKQEQQEADFLRSRGLEPRPSRLPEQFQKGLKAYRPKAGSSTDSTRRQ